MCDIRKYPDLYAKADWFLRITHMNKEMLGYELLRRAIVIWVIEGDDIEKEVLEDKTTKDVKSMIEEKLIKRVEEIAPMALSRGRVLASERNITEQAMLEAIRSISESGVKTSVLDFVDDIKKHMF